MYYHDADMRPAIINNYADFNVADIMSQPLKETMFTERGREVGNDGFFVICGLAFWAPSQYKDRLIYVWRFPC